MADAKRLTACDGTATEVPPADLSPSAREFVEAIRTGLAGDAGRMQQLLRRSLSRPVAALGEHGAGLRHALLLAAAQAAPPVPGGAAAPVRGLVESWQGPVPVPGFRFRPPETTEPVARRPQRPRGEPQEPPAGPFDETDLPIALALDAAPAHEPRLPAGAREAVHGLVAEHTTGQLAARGLPPTRTVLLTGPPGTGKTMTARWIAARLGRRLLVLDLASVMSNELGRSAQNLAEALDTAQRSDAVLFVDEFDAVASARADANDVGEMRRLVNVLLVRLDRWPPGRLLIAATNHPELLDRAVGRRFEAIVELPPPDLHARAEILAEALPGLADEERAALAAASEGLSGSDLATGALQAARRAALRGADPALTDVLAALCSRGRRLPRAVRDDLIRALDGQALSSRRIGELVGVSHVTVRDVLKRGRAVDGAASPVRRGPARAASSRTGA